MFGRGQDGLGATGSDGTGLTGTLIGLTGSTGLTGDKTGLTGASSESGSSSKAKTKIRLSFKFLLAKYEEGSAQKQKRRPNMVKDAKSTSIFGEQSDSQPYQDNYATMSYSRPVTPWYWLYPDYYTSLYYSRMHMQSYYIQYPSMYSSCVSSRPIVTSNNLVKKDINCSKECEKDIKQNSKYLKPR